LLRGVDLFEDVTVSTLVTWDSHGMPEFDRVAGLIDRLGFSLPRNPTLHSFPTPERILARAQSLNDVFTPDSVMRLTRVAQTFTTQRARIDLLVRQPIDGSVLASRLAEELLLDEPGVGLLMLYLGRYDYVPTDSIVQRRVGEYWEECVPVPRQEITAFFDRWHPWGGLAYWLWDWSKVPTATTTATPASTSA
jgi:3-methyladenine DNA glycosylase/8-oxoguanine DNA glycosylase